jgi:hypothetical protein
MRINNMKKLITLLAITLVIAMQANAQGLIKNEIDEFSGNRIIQSDYIKIDHEGFSGRAFTTAMYSEGDYFLVLNTYSNDSWQLLSTDSADFVIDGQRSTKDLYNVDSDVDGGVVMESKAFILSKDEFEEFASAETVKFRANRNIYTLTDKAKQGIRIVLTEINK